MALLRFDLPPRRLAGLYSRIVRRELGFPPPFVPRNVSDKRDVVGLFARSLAVGLGQSFAAGEFVRHEFAQALRDRLRNYRREDASNLIFPLVEAIDHAAALAEIVAGTSSDSRLAGIEISDDAIAGAAQTDFFRLSQEGDIVDWSPNGPLGSLWRGEQPRWWRQCSSALPLLVNNPAAVRNAEADFKELLHRAERIHAIMPGVSAGAKIDRMTPRERRDTAE